jgi:tetratricopeptide (TPR) repeat protein
MGTSMSLEKKNKHFGSILKSPSMEEVLTLKGDNYRLAKQYDLALLNYNRALKINPYNFNILNNKAF